MPKCQKLKTMGEERHRSETPIARIFDARLEKIETRGSGQESQGLKWRWRRKRQKQKLWDKRRGQESGDKTAWTKKSRRIAVKRKEKGSVRRETNVVSGMRVVIVQNRHQKPLHPLSHQHQGVEVRREKETSEARARLLNSIDSRGNTSWKVLALNYLVSLGILPNVNSVSLNRDVNSAQSAYFRTGRVEEQPNKKPEM